MSEREKSIFKNIKRLNNLDDIYKPRLDDEYYHFIKDPKNTDKGYRAITTLKLLIITNILLLQEYFNLTEKFKEKSSEYNILIDDFSPVREIIKDFITPRVSIRNNSSTSSFDEDTTVVMSEYEDDFSDEDDSEKKEDEYEDDFILGRRYNYRKKSRKNKYKNNHQTSKSRKQHKHRK